MALVNSGQIELGTPAKLSADRNITTEFGSGDMNTLRNMGIAGVPTTNVGFNNFYGTSSYTPPAVNIGNFNITGSDASAPYSITARLLITPNVTGGNGTYTYFWGGPFGYTGTPGVGFGINASDGSFSLQGPATTRQVFINMSNTTQTTGIYNATVNYSLSVNDTTATTGVAFSVNGVMEQGSANA